MNIYGAFVLAVSSSLLISYSSVASERGWAQGTFFLTYKAAILGWLGMISSLIVSYLKSGFTGLLGVLIGSLLLTGALLAALRSQAQIIGLFGFVVGCVWVFI